MLMVIESACSHNKAEVILLPSTLKNGGTNLMEYFIRVFIKWAVLLHIFRIIEYVLKILFQLEIIIKPAKPWFFLHIQKKCPVGEWHDCVTIITEVEELPVLDKPCPDVLVISSSKYLAHIDIKH